MNRTFSSCSYIALYLPDFSFCLSLWNRRLKYYNYGPMKIFTMSVGVRVQMYLFILHRFQWNVCADIHPSAHSVKSDAAQINYQSWNVHLDE